MEWNWKPQPIGIVRSCFPCKNGTPRQSTISPLSRGLLKISKDIYNNPEHSLQGLDKFSHIWIIFLFHKNKAGRFAKAKVSPPRLNGEKIGVFATRSPYRWNPIGLSLVRLESIEGDVLHFSGHDLVDGTPVLDIKPYIREYDDPPRTGCLPAAALNCTPGRDSDTAAGAGPAAAPAPSREIADAPAGGGPPQAACERGEPHGDDTEAAGAAAGSDAGPAVGTVAGEDWDGAEAADRHLLEAPALDGSRRPPTHRGDSATHLNIDDTDHHAPEIRATTESDGSPTAEPGRLTSAAPGRPAADSAGGGAGPGPLSPATPGATGGTWLERLRPELWRLGLTPAAEAQLGRFSAAPAAGRYRLRWLRDAAELRAALGQVLCAEPRSVYRRARADHLLYHFAVDACHVTCWFDAGRRLVEVLRLQPLEDSPVVRPPDDGVSGPPPPSGPAVPSDSPVPSDVDLNCRGSDVR